MQRIFLYSFIIVIILFSVFTYSKSLKPKQNNTKKNNIKVTVIAYCHNIEDICDKIIDSISNQSIKADKIILIDDNSTDFTFKKLNLLTNTISSPCIILNEYHKGFLTSVYESIMTCDDNDLIILLDNRSWFSNLSVIETIKNEFSKYDIWLAYSKDMEINSHKKSSIRRINPQNMFSSSMRKKYWKNTHIKSFYASLFKNIKLQDLFFRGKMIDPSLDMAYMFPMMEMAGKHTTFLSQTLCFYDNKYKKDFSIPSHHSPILCERTIRRINPYNSLKNFPQIQDLKNKNNVDLVIFSYDRPMQLYSLLESIEKYVSGLNKISIIYRCSHERFFQAYLNVKKNFPKAQFIKQSKKPHTDFKLLTMKSIFYNENEQTEYILFAVDDLIIKDYIDLNQCIKSLNNTDAYSFSLRLGEHINYCYMGSSYQKVPNRVKIEKNIIGWQVNSAQGDWFYPNSVDLTLYRKRDIKKAFTSIDFRTPNELEIEWNKYIKPSKKMIGLSFTESKAVNIPLNIVNKSENKNMNLYTSNDLLEKFEHNLKINIEPLHKLKNKSVHMEFDPEFIKR